MERRIGCILEADEDTVKLLGYGTYVGETVPPKTAGGFAPVLNLIGEKNPTIELDSGDTIYGCECWWSDEAIVKDLVGDRKVIHVNIEDYRPNV